MTQSSRRREKSSLIDSELESLAAEAVATLRITTTIEHIRPTLFEQVEECDRFASPTNHPLFIATSLPLANALIHYAVDLDALENARRWSAERWPSQDSTSMLAALTLTYIIQQGVKYFANDPERSGTWKRIHRRIASLVDAEVSEPAVA